MKNIFILLLTLCINSGVFSQLFIDTTKVWNVATCSGGGVGWFCQNYSYKFSGDTIINNQVYNKLLIKQDSTILPWIFSIAMREVGNKIYSYTNSGEELSYDFGANVGDTIKQIGSYLFEPMIVDSIDTIFISGAPRKRMLFYHGSNIWPYEIWVEGIGSLKGIANTIIQFNELWADYDEITLCYWENNNLIYIDNTLNTCFIINNVSEIDLNNDFFNLYPNPAFDNVNLEFISNQKLIPKIEISDIFGRTIGMKTPEKYLGENKYTIHVSELQPGIYFIKLYMNEKIITKKFIKN